MYRAAAEKLAENAIANHVIPAQEKELYVFAYETLFARFLSWGTILLIGLIFHCIIGTLFFIATFFPLRIYAGGFHERSYGRCFLASNIIFGVWILCYKVWAPYLHNYIILFLIVSLIVVLTLAPIGDKNKPLSEAEIKKYGTIAKSIAVIQTIIILIMLWMNIGREILLFSTFSMITEAALLLLSKFPITLRSKNRAHA
ncbi:accessory gene regulator B family protein [Marasmitruncus massiliensis]|uniref:accessory gene regulator B family protein n=1 Tax=Marasmitruncus massiliensis TaxID=1944642 RepID=UPI000C7BAEE5|nr:accessory gene regulator B family protein [Marasmitruncus massiliensis]